MNNTALIITVILVILALLILSPLALLWSLTQLFGLDLPWTLANWAAALVLMLLFGGAGAAGSKS